MPNENEERPVSSQEARKKRAGKKKPTLADTLKDKEFLDESIEMTVSHGDYEMVEAIHDRAIAFIAKGEPPETYEPNTELPDVPRTEQRRAELSRYLSELLTLTSERPVTSDEEIVFRLGAYFKRCTAIGKTPTWEDIGLVLGRSDSWLNSILHGNGGFTRATCDILQKAKRVLQAFDAQLVISGQMNPVAYIFRAKNFYGMTDRKEIDLEARAVAADDMTAEELEQRYADIEIEPEG